MQRENESIGKFLRSAVMSALLLGSPVMSSATDSFGYTVSSKVPFTYKDVSLTGSSVLSNTDDGTSSVQIGFLFSFYGVGYSGVCVSTNGSLTFGGCPQNDVSNVDLSAVNPPGNLPQIAPFWTDLTFSVPNAGSVVYQTVGTPGSRRFIVQWNNVFAQKASTPYNFEAILFEGTNNIQFQYATIQGGSSDSEGAGTSIGIRDANGAKNGHVLQFSYDVAVLKNMSALQFTAPPLAPPIDVSSSVDVTTSAFVYSRESHLFHGTITIQNISTSLIKAPVSLVLSKLTTGVTATNATGSVNAGPYYAVSSSALTPGQSVTISVQFSDRSGARIDFVPITYSGSIQLLGAN